MDATDFDFGFLRKTHGRRWWWSKRDPDAIPDYICIRILKALTSGSHTLLAERYYPLVVCYAHAMLIYTVQAPRFLRILITLCSIYTDQIAAVITRSYPLKNPSIPTTSRPAGDAMYSSIATLTSACIRSRIALSASTTCCKKDASAMIR